MTHTRGSENVGFSLSKAVEASRSAWPSWSRGWRTHGYFIGTLRFGWVSKPPGRRVDGHYGWDFEAASTHGMNASSAGVVKTLRQAKRMVERAYRQWRKEHGVDPVEE